MAGPSALTPAQRSAPGIRCIDATPANSDLTDWPKALYIWAAGTIVFIPAGNSDSEILTKTVVAGQIIPIETRQVRTGTTATVGLLY